MQVFSDIAKNLTKQDKQDKPESKADNKVNSDQQVLTKKIKRKEKIKSQVYEACLARLHLLNTDKSFIENEEPNIQLDRPFAYIEMPDRSRLFSPLIQGEEKPENFHLLKKRVLQLAVNSMKDEIGFFAKVIQIFQEKPKECIDIICASFQSKLKMLKEERKERMDIGVNFLKNQIAILQEVVSEDFNEFTKQAQIVGKHQEKSYTRKMKSKKDLPIPPSWNGEPMYDCQLKFLFKTEVFDKIQKEFLPSKSPLKDPDDKLISDKIRACHDLKQATEKLLQSFRLSGVVEFYRDAFYIAESARQFAKSQASLEKMHKDKIRDDKLFRKAQTDFKAEHDKSIKIVSQNLDTMTERLHLLEKMGVKFQKRVEESMQAIHLLFPQNMQGSISEIFVNKPDTEEAIKAIADKITLLANELKGSESNSDFNPLSLQIDQLTLFFKNSLAINKEHNETIALSNKIKEIKSAIAVLSVEAEKLSNLATTNGFIANPDLSSSMQELVSGICDLSNASARCLRQQNEQQKAFTEAMAQFEKERTEIRSEINLRKIFQKQLEHQKTMEEMLEAHKNEVKARTEAFQSRVAKRAEENLASKKSKIMEAHEALVMEGKIREEELQARNKQKFDLLKLVSQNEFRHFKPLVEMIFRKPTPHYEIEFEEIKNLIESMGGTIKSEGGGSHRTVKLIECFAYFGQFSNLPEESTVESKKGADKSSMSEMGKMSNISVDNGLSTANGVEEGGGKPSKSPSVLDSEKGVKPKGKKTGKGKKKRTRPLEETTGIVVSHKVGVPRGKLSRYDVDNIRALFERCNITLENIAKITDSARISDSPNITDNVNIDDSQEQNQKCTVM